MTEHALKILERRVKPRVEVKVWVKMADHEQTYTGNLSKSGVFLETSEPFAAIGDKVQLSLTLPDSSDQIRVTGKVIRVIGPHRVSEAPGVGIEFLRIEARQTRTFERMIDKLLDARGIGCRKYPRMKTQLVVELRTQSQIKEALSENLSKGGAFLKTEIEGLVLGDTVKMVFLHPSSKKKFETSAKVVHLRKGESKIRQDFVEGIGIEFIGLSLGRKNEMSLFLRSVLEIKGR